MRVICLRKRKTVRFGLGPADGFVFQDLTGLLVGKWQKVKPDTMGSSLSGFVYLR